MDRNHGFPPSRFRLGLLYEKRGLQEPAIEQYSRAFEIDHTMRDPPRNPLIVDTNLLDRVTVRNYSRSLAVASMASGATYADRDRLRKVPLDRSLSSGDMQPQPPEAPLTTTAPAAGPTPDRYRSLGTGAPSSCGSVRAGAPRLSCRRRSSTFNPARAAAAADARRRPAAYVGGPRPVPPGPGTGAPPTRYRRRRIDGLED